MLTAAEAPRSSTALFEECDVTPGNATSMDSARSDSSASKVLRLLDAFVGPQAHLGLTELADRAKLPRSTAHRLLGTLAREGYVHRVRGRYCLSNRTFEVGHHAMTVRPNGLRERAMPFLTDLFLQTRQTVHLAILDGAEVLYLEKIFGHNSVRTGTSVGARRPAHATALGKALLAASAENVWQEALGKPLLRYTERTWVNPDRIERQLHEVRGQGFATDRDELIRGLSCVAAPIRDPLTGEVVAAVSVSARSGPEVVRRFSRAVVQTAQMLSQPSGNRSYASA